MNLFSILLQEGPAETTNYMILGYTVIFGVLAIYLISLFVRNRNLKHEAQLLEELEQEDEAREQAVAAGTTSTSSVQNAQ